MQLMSSTAPLPEESRSSGKSGDCASMASQNVLILTSNTGGGHRSAAKALEHSLLSLEPGHIGVNITQVLEEANYVSRKAADFYNFLLRDHQDFMRYYFWAINRLRPNESRLIFRSAMNYGRRVFEKMMPNVIVSVHPMTQHFFAYMLKRLNLIDKIPLLTVVTDPYYGFWKGWACKDVSQYYVASDYARQQLVEFGVDACKIQVLGMPVHSKFHPVSEEQKQVLRTELGLEPERFTVFINAGWVGGGNAPRIFEALVRDAASAQLNIQVLFLAGHNELLMKEAQHIAKSASFPVKVLAYTNEIERLMNASDVMVSKMGGLTTFEALSCLLPIIADAVTPPMPQERQTAAYLEKTGAAIMLRSPGEIVSVLESLLHSPGRYHALKEAASLHGKPGASDLIAKDVLRHIQPVHLGTPALV